MVANSAASSSTGLTFDSEGGESTHDDGEALHTDTLKWGAELEKHV